LTNTGKLLSSAHRSPRTAALSEADRRQAVTALAELIAEWWTRQQDAKPTSHIDPEQ
jgi:hypothetical protein